MKRFPLLSKPSLRMSGRSFTIYSAEDQIHGVLGETVDARLTTKGVEVLFPDRDDLLGGVDPNPFDHPLAGGGITDNTFTGRTYQVNPIDPNTVWYHPEPLTPRGRMPIAPDFDGEVAGMLEASPRVAPNRLGIDWAAIGDVMGTGTRDTQRVSATVQAYTDMIRESMGRIEEHGLNATTGERLADILRNRMPLGTLQVIPRDTTQDSSMREMAVQITSPVDFVTLGGNIVIRGS